MFFILLQYIAVLEQNPLDKLKMKCLSFKIRLLIISDIFDNIQIILQRAWNKVLT